MNTIARPKIAFFDFAGCEGCQLTALDALQTHPELLDMVEIVQFREAMSARGEDYQVAFVEGGCTRPEDEARLRHIRDQARYVIAFGACAHTGGLNALRSWQSEAEVKRYVYGERGRMQTGGSPRPVEAVVAIDGFLPGCPVDREEFIRAVRYLLQDRLPEIPDYPVCVECRLQEIPCLLRQGQPCLGPVTRAGCRAICLRHGLGCLGCRGPVPDANLDGLEWAFAEVDLAPEEVRAGLRLFQSYPLMSSEK